tara:strand:+ start:7302 stop:8270 length:969 start_codon:yes stop_codon:yes gene_type:complete
MFLYLFLLTILISNKSLAFTIIKSKVSNIKLNMQPKGGSNVALVTPMKNDNKIDYESLVRLLKWHEKEQTDGIVLLGTTGEGSTINMSERSRIIETAVNLLKNKIPIIVGTGAVDPNKVIELTKNAKDLGADASLVITPYYVKPPQRALITHFSTIADSIDLPLILYNCPGRTGVDMIPETISKLSLHPNIIGVKDASGDLSRVESLRNQCEKGFLLYGGEDDQGYDFVKMGGDGVISVTANLYPLLEHCMLKLAKEGNYELAEKINNKLMPIHKNLFIESNPIPVKRALNIIGKIDSGIRPPLTQLNQKHYIKLKNIINSI